MAWNGLLALSVTALFVAAATVSAAATPSLACKGGSVPAVVEGKSVCLSVGQPCKTRYERIYRAKRFHCAAGRLRKLAPSRPAPTSSARAQAGHYQGRTSQNEAFFFDVTADGSRVVNLGTGQINESCTPNAYLSGGNLNGFYGTIGAGGGFSIKRSGTSVVGGASSTYTVAIGGRFSGGIASGTIVVTSTFTYDSTPYSCTSNNQTWYATRTS